MGEQCGYSAAWACSLPIEASGSQEQL